MDRLTAISTFVKVVDARGFSAAAFQLRVSPAVVSTRIQSLERRLGVRLLNRTTRSVALTDSGRSYYERCAAFLYDMDEAEQAARSADSAT
jgi:DNA-binding transcriptional LysR family regulator